MTNVTAAASAATNDQLDFQVWSKNVKNTALKRAATITKHDTKLSSLETRISKEDKLLRNVKINAANAKRLSLPDALENRKFFAGKRSPYPYLGARVDSLSSLSFSFLFISSFSFIFSFSFFFFLAAFWNVRCTCFLFCNTLWFFSYFSSA